MTKYIFTFYNWYFLLYSVGIYTSSQITLNYINASIPTKHWKSMFMRASGASEVENFDILHTKSAIFLPIFCRYTSDILSVQIIGLWYGAIYKRKYTDKALTLWKIYVYICERAERGSYRTFLDFYILKALFLSIFCRYKWYAYGMALNINASIPTSTNTLAFLHTI